VSLRLDGYLPAMVKPSATPQGSVVYIAMNAWVNWMVAEYVFIDGEFGIPPPSPKSDLFFTWDSDFVSWSVALQAWQADFLANGGESPEESALATACNAQANQCFPIPPDGFLVVVMTDPPEARKLKTVRQRKYDQELLSEEAEHVLFTLKKGKRIKLPIWAGPVLSPKKLDPFVRISGNLMFE